MSHQDERRRAARIHYSFLPEDYADERIEVAASSVPAGELGGDYCSILPLRPDRVVVCLCDAVGHDIGSALYAARINTFVLAHAGRATHPCGLLEELNAFLCRALEGIGMFASFFVAFIDMGRGVVDYAGAGHPPALHYHGASGCVEELRSEATLLGLSHPAPLACSATRSALGAGDKLLFYTDGVIEHGSPRTQGYGVTRLRGFLAGQHGLSSRDFNRALMTDLERFESGPTRDDMLAVTATLAAPGP